MPRCMLTASQVHECSGMGPVAEHTCTEKGMSAQNLQLNC